MRNGPYLVGRVAPLTQADHLPILIGVDPHRKADEESAEGTVRVFQLGYASAATEPFSPDALRDLLTKARTNNSALDVTGMLLYHEGSFIQILEGDQTTVESLYAKIAADPRHSNSILLFKVDTDERAFDQWTMGFHQLNRDTDDTPEGLNRFLDNGIPGITSDDGEKIRDILLGFREGKWRRTVDH